PLWSGDHVPGCRVATAPAAARRPAAWGIRSASESYPSGVILSSPSPVTTKRRREPYIATPSSGMPRSAGGKIRPSTGAPGFASLRSTPAGASPGVAAGPRLQPAATVTPAAAAPARKLLRVEFIAVSSIGSKGREHALAEGV